MKLINARSSKLLFENRLDNEHTNIQVKQKFNTRVHYHDDNRCTCIYEVIVTDVDENLPFNINVEVVGTFEHEEGMTQTDIHIEATKQLYPYLKTAVAMLTGMSGSPAFYIRPHEIHPEDIQSNAKPGDKIS